MTSAAIVLAGGRSTRMGEPKAALEWHGSTLVRHVAGLVARAVDGPVVVVCAAQQPLPPLPPHFEIVEDARDARGPLQGIAAGLDAVGDRAQVVFVTGVDAPFLHPAFVAHVVHVLETDGDVALPRAHGFAHPLAAAYRAATVAPLLDDVLAGERLGTGVLLARCRVRELDEAALLADRDIAAFDPHLRSLTNINTRAEYAHARERAAPQITVGGRHVRAATLAQAAARSGMTIGADTRPCCNGLPVADPQAPLAEGDDVVFAGVVSRMF